MINRRLFSIITTTSIVTIALTVSVYFLFFNWTKVPENDQLFPGVRVRYKSVRYNTDEMKFKLFVEDPVGIKGMTVRAFCEDWDPFQDQSDQHFVQLLEGSPQKGLWVLSARYQYQGRPLSCVDQLKGWYVVWRRMSPSGGGSEDFVHAGQNGLYQTYQEVQQDAIPFSNKRRSQNEKK